MNRFIILFMLLSLYACTTSYNNHLLSIENYVEDKPDLAKHALDSISNNLDNNADKALLIILRSRADFEDYIREQSDSAMVWATNYFMNHNDKFHLMNAYYLLASKYFYNNDDKQAILAATNAYELAKKTENSIWIAKTAELIGDIYSSTYLHEEALEFRNIAADYYKKSKRTDKYLMSMANVALSHDNLGQKTLSLNMIEDVIQEASIEPVDSSLWYHLMRVGFLMSMQNNSYELADSLYPSFRKYLKYHNFNYDLIMSARLEAIHDNTDEAIKILNTLDSFQLDNITNAQLNSTFAYIYASLEDYEKAFKYKMNESRYSTNAENDIIGQPAVMALRDFYNQTAVNERLKANQLRMSLFFGIIIVILAAIWLRWHTKLTLRLKNAEMETMLSDISSLHADLTHQKQQKNDAIERMRSIYGQQWSALNMLSCQLNTLEDNDISRKRVLRQIEHGMKKMAEPNNIQRLVNEADSLYDGLFSTLKQKVDDIKDMDIAILVMIIAGMNTYTQCYITGLNRNTYYSRRRRLMIRLSQCPDESAKTILRLIDGSN